MSDFKMPMNGKEVLQLQYLAYLVNTMIEGTEIFEKRTRKMGIFWRFKGLAKQADNLYRAIRKTLPKGVEERFVCTLNLQKLYIVTKGGAVDPTGDFTVVPRRALLGILTTASKECLLCDGSSEERRKCPYRRAIKDLCLPDLSHAEDNGICLGKKFKWEANSGV